ncbi:MAG: lysophospholipid acyltransferase family protein [Planctomycetota bacterium]|jgi:1-acyl-sn-glycerol-3-phosphate acyltransferase
MRSAIGTVLAVCGTILMGLVALLSLIFGKRFGAAVTHYWGRFVMASYWIRADVRGREHVGKGPYVIVANHSSMLDIPTMAAFVPIAFHFVSRPFFFKVPFMGWGMLAAGHISIERGKAREAKQTLQDLEERLKSGISVCLFPEGTRSPDGTVQKYKRGPFMTAVLTGTPILPVSLGGVAARLPKKKLIATPGRIKVTFGEPIPTEGMTQRDTKELARRIEEWTRAEANMVSSAAAAKA